jgi:hypothetical protein
MFLGTLPAQTANQTNETTLPHEISQVRIVRLSEVKGAVQLDRNTGAGYEAVMANLPIVEHSRLQTGNGVAEVEFEDNSTLRIAPNSIVEFPELDRLPGGTTVSSIRLLKGTAYVSLLKTKESRGNEFNLLFGQQKVQLPPASHIRLQVDDAHATLAVLDGNVPLNESAATTDVSRNRTATFDLVGQTQPTVAKDVVPATFDAWDKNAAATHAQSVASTAFGSPYSYGIGDMMYYGSFMDAGGCGSMWRPYFASAAWDPYSNGVWAWYQGAGYSWVSPYPWGWTPFHFGSWAFCPGAGWGWRPGGSWNGLNNTAYLGSTGGGTGSTGTTGTRPFPPRPIRPPGPGQPTFTVVNRSPLVRSEVSADSFVFRKDSAGLGVPRQGLGNLNKFSQGAITRGVATTPVYVEGRSPENGGFRPGEARPGENRSSESLASGSIHRGSAPSPQSQTPSQSGASAGRGPENSGNGGAPRSAPEPSSQSSRSFSPPPSSSPAPSAAPSAPAGHH